MKQIKLFAIAILSVVLFTQCNTNVKKQNTSKSETKEAIRIVSLSGTITEIICKAGLCEQLVGVDVTSNYPKTVQKLPKVGHRRSVSAEAVLELNPSLVLGLKKTIKPALIKQLEAGGAKVVLFDLEYSVDGAKKLIAKVCGTIGKKEAAETIQKDIEASIKKIDNFKSKPKVLFIYARGAGTLMVAGKNTSMYAFIQLSGGKNAISGFEGFKPLNAEALIAANPEVVLMFNSGKKSVAKGENRLNIPGLDNTIAGKQKNIITMDGQYISGFGPRLGKAILDFNQKLKQFSSSAATL